jgi:site-specific DNA-methyltransferase (adenine-specific)
MSNASKPKSETINNDQNPEARDKSLELWGDKPAIVFGSWKVDRPKGTRHRLIWHKAANIPGMRSHPWFNADEEIYVIGTGFQGKPEQNVLVTNDRRDGAYGEVARLGHPTPKPVALWSDLMGYITNKDDLLYEPFSGSGTTLIAAEQLNRKCFGMEISPQYCDVIIKRWEALTGETAVLETKGGH